MDLLFSMLAALPSDLSPGRMAENILLIFIVWRIIGPHLKTIELRLAGLESAVNNGFKSGEARFEKIEDRVQAIEHKQNLKGLQDAKSV